MIKQKCMLSAWYKENAQKILVSFSNLTKTSSLLHTRFVQHPNHIHTFANSLLDGLEIQN